MADILKITTPMITNKNQTQPSHQVLDPSVPTNMAEIQRVIQANQNNELFDKNGLLQGEGSPNILMNLLKDPSVTVGFLKNIFMLQEIISLLPIRNTTITEELHHLFNSLLIKADDIVPEILRQADSATIFKGDLFDFLREMVYDSNNPDLKYAVTNLLKAINGTMSRESVLNSVASNLKYLAGCLAPSKVLSAEIMGLSDALKSEDAMKNFLDIKKMVLEVLDKVENNVLFSEKMEKILPIIKYNLSRYNNNPDFMREALSNLLISMDGKEEKEMLINLVKNYMDGDVARDNQSKIMDVIAEIIGKGTSTDDITLLSPDKIEKIIHSLLSSPCNFTPLLHFVIPVEFMNIKSFAEIWIDPNAGDGGSDELDKNDCVHALIVFEIEGIGSVEVEFFVRNKKIDLAILFPEPYVTAFKDIGSSISSSISHLEYSFNDIRVDKLQKARSLMDVFKSLPYKRTGVDTKA